MSVGDYNFRSPHLIQVWGQPLDPSIPSKPHTNAQITEIVTYMEQIRSESGKALTHLRWRNTPVVEQCTFSVHVHLRFLSSKSSRGYQHIILITKTAGVETGNIPPTSYLPVCCTSCSQGARPGSLDAGLQLMTSYKGSGDQIPSASCKTGHGGGEDVGWRPGVRS